MWVPNQKDMKYCLVAVVPVQHQESCCHCQDCSTAVCCIFNPNYLMAAGPLVEGIMQSEIDDSFQEQLLALHRKLNFLEKNEAAQFSAAYRSARPVPALAAPPCCAGPAHDYGISGAMHGNPDLNRPRGVQQLRAQQSLSLQLSP